MALRDMLLDPVSTSKYGLAGNKGPEFENESMKFTSDIQALTTNPISNELKASQDLLSGRLSRQIPGYPYFQAASEPPVSFPTAFAGKPAPWGPYKSKGPAEGRY